MSIIIGNITLAQRDRYIVQIKNDVRSKQISLLKKRRELADKVKMNVFLEKIMNDYEAYYNHIIMEKQKQYDALNKLYTYIEKLDATNDQIDSHIAENDYEQRELLHEMTNIKKELDNIISRTK